MRVPLVDLTAQHASLAAEILPRVTELLATQNFILGPAVAAFEATLTRLSGARHAVGVASGSDALVLALLAAGVGRGDGVITSAFGFVATAEAIVRVGAVPIFADVDEASLLDVGSVAAVLDTCTRRADGVLVDVASGAALRAVLSTHLFGACVESRALTRLLRERDVRLAILEDAAQAILATDEGDPAGSQGDFAALSFFPSKNLGAWGDGGAVLGRDDAAMARVRRLRVHGLSEGTFVEVGMNSRLDALQAVVLDVKARHLEAWTQQRIAVADRYRAELADVTDLRLPPPPRPGSRHVYHQFVVRTPRRDALARHLADAGVQTRPYYPRPLHEEPCFAGLARCPVPLPEAAGAAAESLGLPMFPELGADAQDYVIQKVRRFFA